MNHEESGAPPTPAPTLQALTAADFRGILEEGGFEGLGVRETGGPQTFILARAK